MAAQVLFFIGYQLLQLFLFPVIFIMLMIRKLQGKPVFGSFKQRLGLVPTTKKGSHAIWIHAVSVGEILATQQLIKELKVRFPKALVYVTTGTAGGKQMAQQHLQADVISFMPYDFLLPMVIAFRRIKPVVVLGVEAEIWPNFLLLAYFKKIPTYLLNGRINGSHAFLKKLFFPLLYKIYQHIYAQTIEDKHNYELLGVDGNRVTVFGNIKAYNVHAKKNELGTVALTTLTRKEKTSAYCVVMVGSAHQGECKAYFSMFKKLRQEYNHVRLVFAPRHFTWQQSLIEEAKRQHFSYYLWDSNEQLLERRKNLYEALEQEIFPQYDVLFVCTLGKLFNLYPLTDIFLLGGTFVPIGGHNLLEPAVWGVPMIVGPYYENTRAIADSLEKNNALYKVSDESALFTCVQELVQDNEKRVQMGDNATKWLAGEAFAVSHNLQPLFNKIGSYYKEI